MPHFLQNETLDYGQQKPHAFEGQLLRKGPRFEAPTSPFFGRTLALFIGDFEASTALGRLAHWLRSLTRPWIDLDRASRGLDCKLQATPLSTEFFDTLASNFGHLVPWSVNSLHKRCFPDPFSCNPAFQLVGKAAGQISLLAKLSKIALWPQQSCLLCFCPFATSPLTFHYCFQDPQFLKHHFSA